jgi:hypothetical protein
MDNGLSHAVFRLTPHWSAREARLSPPLARAPAARATRSETSLKLAAFQPLILRGRQIGAMAILKRLVPYEVVFGSLTYSSEPQNHIDS